MHRYVSLMLFPLLLLWTVSCHHTDNRTPEVRGMYCWRTTFSPDSAERNFLNHYGIDRLYIRFFDVVSRDGKPQPNATISFADSIPKGREYVPVVFITPEVMSSYHPELPEMILRRIEAMSSTNDLTPPDEIQIDCDWTSSTRENFFAFMTSLDSLADRHGITTSVTIRLHQLSSEPPAADYGVLMLYNTGDVRNPNAGNPILSREAVMPYLRYLSSYDLPLVLALPDFRWPVLYAPGADGSIEYRAILYGCNPEAEPDVFRQTASGEWIAISSRRYNTSVGSHDVVLVVPGMTLRIFTPPSFDELQSTISAIRKERREITKSVILYDLNPSNQNNYTPQQYEKIFNP